MAGLPWPSELPPLQAWHNTILDNPSTQAYTDNMIAPRTALPRVWTEAELEALPEDGYLHEVVNGELIMSPKNNWYHGRICTRLVIAIGNFVTTHRLGAVLDSSTGFWMFNRNCRAPDVSFVPKSRLAALGFRPNEKRFFPGAPDLAIEVLSENNTRAEIDDRLRDFFASGTQIAWIIDPDLQRVEVCHSPTQRSLIGSGGFVEGEQLLPGFRYAIADLFKDWDWD
jgi:Uma2 family endonuclease